MPAAAAAVTISECNSDLLCRSGTGLPGARSRSYRSGRSFSALNAQHHFRRDRFPLNNSDTVTAVQRRIQCFETSLCLKKGCKTMKSSTWCLFASTQQNWMQVAIVLVYRDLSLIGYPIYIPSDGYSYMLFLTFLNFLCALCNVYVGLLG